MSTTNGGSGRPSRTPGRLTPRCCALVWLGLALLLAGCDAGPPGEPPPLTVLHVPGVRLLFDTADLHAPFIPRGGIVGISAYGPPATGATASAGAVVNVNGQLADVSLASGAPRPIPPGGCDFRPVAVTPDGAWVACSTADGIRVTPRAARTASDSRTLLPATPDQQLQAPAWAPDGRRLAIATNEGGCAVAVYAVSANHQQATRSALLRFPDLVATGPGPYGCTIFGLSWSPDGAWLGLMVHAALLPAPPRQRLMYALRLASLGRPPVQSGRVAEFTVARASLLQVGETWTDGAPTWSETPAGPASTFADFPTARHLVRVDPASGARTTLVSVNEGAISAAAWTPDGRQLVFALVDPCAESCSSGSSQLYVYTPPS